MLKKKKNIQLQIILKFLYKNKHLENLLVTSFSKNHFLEPLNRISFFYREDAVFNKFFRFNTIQRLYCLNTSSPKVPNKKYLYSRFFLNKQLENLTVSNTLK